ncbi:MAG: transcription-repair coupling factor [Calditrichaeota bacterium]|nr:MAG: transcription-repair coupling factor [Calditrichota bacterium]
MTIQEKINQIDRIYNSFRSTNQLIELSNQINNNKIEYIPIAGLHGSGSSFLLKSIKEETNRPIFVITETTESARDYCDDLAYLIDSQQVAFFPSRQILPYDFRAPVGEIMGQRISTLSDLLDNKVNIVVLPIRALIEPTITVNNLENNRLVLHEKDEIELDDLVQKLIRLGFKRVVNVEEVGDFAQRGGLVDFFSPGSEAPVRLELFGDEVDTIRQFDVRSQRTINRINSVSILPKREILIRAETIEEKLEELNEDDADFIRYRYLNDPELPGLEWLSLMFGEKQGSLFDYIDDNSILFFEGQGSLINQIDHITDEAKQLYSKFSDRLTNLPTPDKYYIPKEVVEKQLSAHTQIDLLPFKGGKKDIIDFECAPHPALGSRLDLLGETLNQYRQLGIDYCIITENSGQADRLKELIEEKSNFKFDANIEVANLKGGFVSQQNGFALLTDHEIFSRHHRRVRRKKFKEGVAISDYTNLTRGDFVVHTDHGIAKYIGLETLTVDNRNRDCLLLKYADEDKLFVPIEEFNRVSKYSGKDSDPVLTRLGGPGWEKLKKKTKKAIELMAEDLILLYAERKAAKGFAFGEDTVWLKQLEASFPYDETPDQQKAIDDVKLDMSLETTMDRLVCGDVGFGKTEVAVRAAFKAIEKGKQVAVLVPTTILAQQHFQTFKERFADFPVNVEMLSRFRTRKEQEAIVEKVAQGKIELVVGTHRLFSKDVLFKDLGLLVIDEEHRFGVRHKEKLRTMKANVDTLSMTATPIPRTLQMSLMGVRDMSLITTSPKDRLPIITEIAEFDPSIIATTILREIDRDGQVFFVHNRVQTIDAMYNYLKKHVPQAEIAVAHGQMHEKSLEGIMLAFMSKRYNVLLCTSIIESGLDIPEANTIIINRADRFGLAQLYQLRGRVGRSSKRAYAYLLTPNVRLLASDAIKRLRAIEAHSDLGSGFALAMRDLEIRGAGSILGAKQSGFIEEIGFDMYNKLLEEAIAKLRGMDLEILPDTKLECDIEMYLDATYVSNRQQKVDIYRRLADCKSLQEIEDIREEVIDRFGKLPKSTIHLFNGTAVKVAASILEIEKVKIRKGKVNLFFKEGRMLKREEVESMRKATDCDMEFSLTGNVQIIVDMKELTQSDSLLTLRKMLSGV